MNFSNGVGNGVGAALGVLVFGPTGAIVGGVVGGFAETVVGNIAGSLGADGVKAVAHRTRRRFTDKPEPQLNHDLQHAFRDALREAIRDIGGATCFPNERRLHLEADPVDYPLTEHGRVLWRDNRILADQICACLRELAQIVMDDAALQPSADQSVVDEEQIILATTSQALNDAFFDQVVAPLLRPFRTLILDDPDFERHLRRHLFDRTLIHLGELLKSERYTPAWRAFNRRVFEELQAELRSIAAGQTEIAADQQQIKQQLDALTTALSSEERIATIAGAQADLLADVGRIEKKLDEGFAAVLQRVTEQHREVIDRLRDGFRAVLRDTAHIKEDVRETRKRIDEIADRVQPPPLTALHSIPDPPADFQGRTDERDQLVAQLKQASANGSAAAISGVRGLGGIGKSTLAFKVAQALRSDFPDAQIMLALRGATTTFMSTEEALREVLRAFGQETDPRLTIEQLKANYCSILTGKHVLILADDAKDAAHVAPLLPPSGCALLITSRKLFRLPGMPDPLELGKLPEPEAIAFVAEICERIGDAAKPLALLCGCLPLALRISATFLANSTRPVQQYLEQLAHERERLLNQRPDDGELSIEASFNLSYAALSPAAQTLLRQLGVFAASFDRTAVENVAPLPEDADLDDLLDELRKISLLDYDPKTERYDLHDLVRVFALQRLREAKEEDALRLRYATFYAALAAAADQLFLEGGEKISAGLALFDTERAHIDAAWTWLREQPPSQPIDQLLMQYADATAYVGDLRYNKRNERIPQLEAALAAARRQQGRQAEGRFLGNLGLAYAALGDVRRAIESYEQHLAIAREIGDRSGEGAALGNLGNAYAALGDVRRAIESYEQAAAIFEEIGDRRATGSTLGNLGNAYAALGDVRRAIESYEQRLIIAREIGDRSGEGNALGNLGNAYARLGDVRRAIESYEQHLAIAREIGDRSGEGAALGNLGLAYAALGDVRRAIESYEQAAAIFEEIGDRRATGSTLGNLGNAYARLGDVRRAIESYEQHLAIAREIGDRSGEGAALGNLGNAYAALGDVRRAIESYEQAAAIFEEIGDRSGEGNALGNLGLAYAALGDVRRAIESYEQAAAIFEEIGDRSGEGNALGNLGNAYAALGDVRRAIESYEQHIAIATSIGDRRGEANSSWNLGRLLAQQGDVARGCALMQVLVDYERELGHPDAERRAAELERLCQGPSSEDAR